MNFYRKKKACDAFGGLDPSKHKLYKTDWLEDPVAPITKEDRSIQTNMIKMGDILVLRDNESVNFTLSIGRTCHLGIIHH